MSRYALVSTAPEFEQQFAAAALGSLAGQINVWEAEDSPSEPDHILAGLDNPALLDVVVLGQGLPAEESLRLAEAFESQRPEVSVLLVAEPDPELVLSAMRSGVRDVVSPRTEAGELGVLLHRAIRSTSIRRRSSGPAAGEGAKPAQARIVAVVSPKGGAGKTTVATNLAVGLAASAPHATVIVDLDLQFGDVASALQLAPEYSLADAVGMPAQKDSMVMKSFLAPHPSGLYALCAPESPADAEQVTGEQVSQLLDQLATEYAYIVIDTSPGLSEHTLAALDKATDFVFVGGMDVPSVRGLRKEMDVLRELGMAPLSRHVVLNAADPRDGLTQRDVEATLGCKVDVLIPNTRAVRLSTNQGVPLLESTKRRDPAAKALRRVVERIAPNQAGALKQRGRHRRG
ncbi:Flp pilus assembly protein ATPase CpaE-like protein [Arthrobacter crystallopoietes BAB-32]|uniref:Flp pilus assembly protein ATPase CpaE-like protein n=1 Tax=Arthrobacter crystallopoietes BAB-32 TaxID=1246476 RepID=N1V6L5_9MICC|nr:AAA family ATPase [Arthrobacter crystallopoietes]EMY33878.1 Flp pilus assembly protein ATPase CpaE-like protein [Arthrobacter crystallopoietes BAB-32]